MAEKISSLPKGITLLGLGPGNPESLTREAWDWLAQIDKLYLRTCHHPTVAHLPNDLTVESFDKLYEQLESFEDVYSAIVTRILDLGMTTESVTYAVPGHPFVAEATCPEIVRKAKNAGVPVRVIDGLSFLEPTFRLLEIDPFPDLFLADAITLSRTHTPGFPPSSPALVAQIYSRSIAADVKLTLMAAYPDEHPVRLVHGASLDSALVEDLPLYKIDQSPNLGLLSSLYVTPLSSQASFESFQEIVARLRAPDGCPWDREQTHLSLRPFLLEETYETLDALDRMDPQDLQEELGDLLLQIVLHAQIATEAGEFNIHQVLEGIGTKLIRRHPHVFSAATVEGVDGVVRNWEAIKAEERHDNGKSEKNGLLDGVPRNLPALSQAQAVIERVKRVNFTRLEELGTTAQIREYLTALEESTDTNVSDLMGQMLLSIASLTKTYGVDAESVLRETIARFNDRFSKLEAHAKNKGKSLADFTPHEQQQLWESYLSNDEGKKQ